MILDIKTSKNINLKIDERQISDFRFVRALADVDSKEEGRILNGWNELAQILFKDQYDEIMQSLTDQDGYTPTDDVINEITHIIKTVKEQKADIKN